MKIKRTVIFILFFVLLAAIYWRLESLSRSKSSLKSIKVGETELMVEIAQSSAQLSKGLGGRDEIGSDGMLFILPIRTIPSFWMKGMRFGLDFVWIDNNKVIVITPNVLPENVADSKLKKYSSGLPTTMVLEIPAGDAAKRGIKVGDIVELR